LGRSGALKTSEILLLKSVKEREGALPFSLLFLLVSRVESSHGLYKSRNICMKRDLEIIPPSLRNSLEKISDIRAYFQNSRELLNRMLFYKDCKIFKRRREYLGISL